MKNRHLDDTVFVVKSHRRVDRFYEKTYQKVILKYGFDLSRVYVFVSLNSDVEAYTRKYPAINIVKAPEGVAAVDNFITDYFPAGQKMIYMNDDVTKVMKLSGGELAEIDPEELLLIIGKMFDTMTRNGITYGGFYPVPNNMFMEGRMLNFGLCIIMDPFSLVINNKKVRITVSDKSDFEKSIQHFVLQGALLRHNHICIKAEYYGKKGGFQGRDKETELESARKMQKLYPKYITGINVKKGGKTSLRLAKLEKRIRIK